MSRRGGGAARGSNLETLFSGLPIEDDSQYTLELKIIFLLKNKLFWILIMG